MSEAAPWLVDPPAPPPHAVRRLKAEARADVWLVQRPGQGRRIVKRWRATPGKRLKFMLGFSQPQRQQHGTRRLERAGVPTPPVVEPPRFVRDAEGQVHVTLELAYAEGQSAWSLLSEDLPDRQWADWGRATGRIVSRTARAGLRNRDLKLDNLLVRRDEREPLLVIDAVGVVRSGSRPRAVATMLERLAVTPAEFRVSLPRPLWLAALRAAAADLTPPQRRRTWRRLRRARQSFLGSPAH